MIPVCRDCSDGGRGLNLSTFDVLTPTCLTTLTPFCFLSQKPWSKRSEIRVVNARLYDSPFISAALKGVACPFTQRLNGVRSSERHRSSLVRFCACWSLFLGWILPVEFIHTLTLWIHLCVAICFPRVLATLTG